MVNLNVAGPRVPVADFALMRVWSCCRERVKVSISSSMRRGLRPAVRRGTRSYSERLSVSCRPLMLMSRV